MLKKQLALLLVLISELVLSQTFTLSGVISSDKELLPFATIHVKGNSMGTNSNMEGEYQLRLAPGTYEIEYQYVGYSKKTETVVLNSNVRLNVSLNPDGISLNEVVIRAGEDPSYPIIRKAIRKRKFYRDQVSTYSCTAYMKGLQRVNSIPKNIGGLIKLVGAELSDTADIKGVVYLAENVSNYYFLDPNEKEVMISSKVSGNSQSFSFNKLSDMNLSLYENLIDMGNLANRPFVSPINDNAFLFYRYYLLGSVTEDGKLIHKIKVVPKQKTDPCFKGIIYVQDSTWRITGIDLSIFKDTKVNFVDTLRVKEIYAPVQGDSIWMPLTINLSFDFK
ncbi:MAG: carboxypeptidase-like regulatory domain-containing protein, partial [Bacteroidia bacterium]|nr:carboxypeptidase-like regulatory domain-containing protein [Bacteroidia bacterium]